jgi:DNA-directed RNA polymerase specialized sigma subunit
VSAAVEDAVTAIRAETDTQAAIEHAAELRELLRTLEGEVAQIRAELAHEIWTTERLTLAQLAERMGVSTGRAGQLVKAAREKPEKEKP